MNKHVKVKDAPELVRDTSSRAILNTDLKGLKQYTQQRQRILEQKRAAEETKSRLDKIETDMSDIKNLLNELLIRSTNGN